MRWALLLCCVLAVSASPALAPKDDPIPVRPPGDWRQLPKDRMDALVYYEDTMLILTTQQGAAAVVFEKPFEEADRRGICYRYRFQPAGGGKEQTGNGELLSLIHI